MTTEVLRRLRVPFFLLWLLVLLFAAQAAGQIRPAPSGPIVQPAPSLGLPSTISSPSAPVAGSITVTLPQNQARWYWTTFQYIRWNYTWTGTPHPSGGTIVTLWKGTTNMNVPIPRSDTGQTGFTVPASLSAGLYELRVTNETDPRIEVRQPVFVEPGMLTFTAPKPESETSWPAFSQQMIEWTYQGSPGPVNLILSSMHNTHVIASNLALVNGSGRATVTIPWAGQEGGYTLQAVRAADNQGVSTTRMVRISAPDCYGQSVSTTSAAWQGSFQIAGSLLDRTCVAEFKPENSVAAVPLAIVSQSAGQLTVQVPLYTPLGKGRVLLSSRSKPEKVTSGFNFSVMSPKPNAAECETFAAQPATGKPGEQVILWGNKGMNSGCTVVFTSAPYAGVAAWQYPAAGQPLDATRLGVRIPMMPPGNAVVTSRLGGAPLAPGVTVAVGEIPPVLTSVSPTSGYAGQTITLVGKAFLPPPQALAPVHAAQEDLRVRLTWGVGKFTDVAPNHVTYLPALPTGEEILTAKLPSEVNSVSLGEFKGSISVYRRVPALMSTASQFTFKSSSQTSTAVSSSCPGGQHIQGLVYVGQPSCATGNVSDHPGAFLRCDSTGYYCCESSQGANTKCGNNMWTYPAGCERFCIGVTNCMVGPQFIGNAMVGCYKPR